MNRREFIKSDGGLILLAGAIPWPSALAENLRQTRDSINDPDHRDEIKRLQGILMDYMVTPKDPQSES